MNNRELQGKDPQKSWLCDPVILLALMWVSVIFLGWPLIQIVGKHGMVALFVYIFAVWGGLIMLLFAISRRLHRGHRTGQS
jgi:hypothetical protein